MATMQEYLNSLCEFCCGRRTCCVGTEDFHPCKTYTACKDCWNVSTNSQRNKDIEKACKWLYDQIDMGKGKSCRVFFIDTAVERLRKAMESES